ncbi:MAG: AlkA N-terminal domain-containing protein [Solirubrobacterales bacterium]
MNPASEARYKQRTTTVNVIELELNATSPFRLDLTAWVLRRRAKNEMDVWDGDAACYRRSIALPESGPVALAVSQNGSHDDPGIQVRISGEFSEESARREVAAALTKVLGLDQDLSGFTRMAAADPDLGPIAERMRGVKPPRFPTVFEALVNGVACQQLSLEVGLHVLNRLTRRYGQPVPGEESVGQAFPGPEDLAGIEPEEVKSLGFSFNKARTIIDASRAIVTSDLDLEGTERLDDETAYGRLTSLRGVGRWTAEYVMLRGLGRTHIFPGDDVGAHNKLRRLLNLGPDLHYETVQELVARWQPWAGLVYFHLLLDSLDLET